MNRNTNKIIYYSITKVLLIPLNLWIISSLVFLLLRIAPGDPVDAILGSGADQSARDLLRNKLGLNASLPEQYINYIGDLLRFNLGESLSTQEPVMKIIGDSLPASIELGIISICIAILIGLPIGFLGLKNKNKKFDYFSRIFGISSYAIPPFWAAMMAQLLFSSIFKIFPIGGRFPIYLENHSITGFLIIDSILSKDFLALQGTLYHLLLPSLTLGFLLSGIFSRSFRLNLDISLNSDYVEAAKCRGISERNIMLKYALPNSLLPILTISGLTIASLAGGALLIEVTFSWPGIALKLHEAITQRDYTLVQGIVIVTSSLIISLNLVVDILIGFFDPRIEY
tara:strand:- start:3233 stop:4255 length:1023 start_codon:yes stop_codon:yes gene_type:complete